MSKPKIYDVITTGTTEPRDIRDRFADTINVKDFGAVGDGVHDDTAAIVAASSTGRPLFMPDTYLISQIMFPDGTSLLGNPTFIDKGVLGDSSVLITFGKDSIICGNIVVKLTPNDNYRFGVRLRSGCVANTVKVYSDTLFNGEACHLSGDNVSVRFLNTINITRGGEIGAYTVLSRGVGDEPVYKNSHLGGYDLCGCTQGLRIGRADSCSVGNGRVQGLDDNIAWGPTNGYNGLLLSGASNITIGDITLDRILEHGVRIGGDDITEIDGLVYRTHDIHFGQIVSSRHGGSALKINSGFSQPAYNITVDKVVSVDAGMRPRTNTRRLDSVRVSHCRNFSCDAVVSMTSDMSQIGKTVTPIDSPLTSITYQAETDIIELNNAADIFVGSIVATACGRSMVAFNEENDVTLGVDIDSYAALKCDNVSIGSIRCQNKLSDVSWFLLKLYATEMPVSRVNVLSVMTQGGSFSGYVHGNTGNISNSYLRIFSGVGLSDAFAIATLDGVQATVTSTTGTGPNFLRTNQLFNTTNSQKTATLLLVGEESAGATGVGGPAIVFTRLASNARPSGGIGAWQHSTTGGNSGLVFMVPEATASEQINPAWLMLQNKAFIPAADNVSGLGNGSNRLKEIFCASGTVNTSDAREKQQVNPYPERVLDAWGNVQLRQFLFNASVEQKGDLARIHSGVIAQQVIEAFANYGLDATHYGFICYDEWEDRYEDVDIVDVPAVLDENGNEISPAQTHKEQTLVMPAGSRYGIRYEEALCLEAAYQRRMAAKLEARIAALEAAIKPEV